MKKWKEKIDSLSDTISLTKLDGILFLAVSVLSGIVLGMLISPRKNARYGCNNGTTAINNWGEKSDEECGEEN